MYRASPFRQLLALSLIAGCFAQFIEYPRNMAIVVGSRVTLRCNTISNPASTILWARDTPSVIIAFGCQLNFGYEVDFETEASGNSCNLVIKNVTLRDAMRYSCATFNPAHTATAELIVLESLTLTAYRNITDGVPVPPDDYVSMTCSANYASTGSILPSIIWSPSGGLLSSQITSSSITSTYLVQAKEPSLPAHTCTLFYERGVDGPQQDPDPPAFQTNSTFEAVDIFEATVCGNILRHDSDNSVSGVPSGWTMCYLEEHDFIQNPAYLVIRCNLFIQHILHFYNSTGLLANGGNFGCSAARSLTDFPMAYACTNGYQQDLMLEEQACLTCKTLAVCLRYPPA